MSEQIDSHIITQYKPLKKIGSGAYGHVWKVQDRKTKCIKALKKNFDAFSNSTDAQRVYREILFLKQLSHPNIVKLDKILPAKNDIDIYLVFEHMDVDLHTLLREGNILQEKHKKYIIYQICKTLYYLHFSDIIHRDLKPSNVLLNEECDAKLCDFGLVRLLEEPDDHGIAMMTDYIATRWYRAPELLMGCHQYSKQIDIWSLGCMVAEIVREKPLFQGTSTINQLEKILSWTGPPSSQDVKSIKVQINSNILDLLNTKRRVNRTEMIPCPSGSANQKILIDFISRMLEFDPSKRITIEQILRHPYLEEFYSPKEIAAIKKTKVQLPINDNTKLSVKKYRSIIYRDIADRGNDQQLDLGSVKINVNPLQGRTSKKQWTAKTKDSIEQSTTQKHREQSRSSILKESKSGTNKKCSVASRDNSQASQARSVSRKKGISVYSKELCNENSRHNRSVMPTMISYSNEKYQKIANRESRVSKKSHHLVPQAKKKSSFTSFLCSSNKLKPGGL